MHAARLQHDLATALRDAIARDDAGKIAEFVRRHPEFTYDRLRGILSGDMWMRLDDITELARLLGLTVRIEFNPTDSNRDSGNRSLALDDATGR